MDTDESSAVFIFLQVVTEHNFYCFMCMILMLTNEG